MVLVQVVLEVGWRRSAHNLPAQQAQNFLAVFHRLPKETPVESHGPFVRLPQTFINTRGINTTRDSAVGLTAQPITREVDRVSMALVSWWVTAGAGRGRRRLWLTGGAGRCRRRLLLWLPRRRWRRLVRLAHCGSKPHDGKTTADRRPLLVCAYSVFYLHSYTEDVRT